MFVCSSYHCSYLLRKSLKSSSLWKYPLLLLWQCPIDFASQSIFACLWWHHQFAFSSGLLEQLQSAISSSLSLPLLAIIFICLFWRLLYAFSGSFYCASSGSFHLPLPASSICLLRQLLFASSGSFCSASSGSFYLPHPAASICLFRQFPDLSDPRHSLCKI